MNLPATLIFAIVTAVITLSDTVGYSQLVTGPQSAFKVQKPTILWRAEVGFQPIDIQAGDITGDGRPDLVIGYSLRTAPGPAIVAIDSSGQILWRFTTQEGVWHVAIGDIDGDGINDVAGYESQLPSFLYAIRHDGTLLWKFQLPKTGSGNEFADHVKIADVTGDGVNEVIVGADGSSALYIFDNHGVVLRTHSVPANGISGIPFVEVADLSGNGVQDIIISYGYICPPCGIQVIDGFGTLLWDFPSPVRLGDAAVGDVDNDGKLDVVVSEWNGTKVSAIANSGSLLWTLSLAGELNTVALANIKEHGKHRINIVAGSGAGFTGNIGRKVTLIDGNGDLIWTFDAKASVTQAAFGDFTGQGKKEIAASSIGGILPINPGITFLNSSGKPIRFLGAEPSTVDAEQRGFRDLVVADLDGDGIDEVVAISEDEFVYALRMKSKGGD